MAAAYLFHIKQNRPFLDGNRRAALATALVFLWLNGQQLHAEEDELTELVRGVASGRIGKAAVGVFIGEHLRPPTDQPGR